MHLMFCRGEASVGQASVGQASVGQWATGDSNYRYVKAGFDITGCQMEERNSALEV